MSGGAVSRGGVILGFVIFPQASRLYRTGGKESPVSGPFPSFFLQMTPLNLVRNGS